MRLPNSARPLYPLLFLLVIALAIVLRAPQLTRRPMHTDEAVHAVKFGTLLEQGVYVYDRAEFHGPTLNYLTLIPARLESADRLSEIDEATLRVVPVVFGVGVVLLLALLWRGWGGGAVVAAGFFTAVSPAMVFYSRYYIQEMLLVFFTFATIACGYRYTKEKSFGWALATGVSLGLMHATKETAIIAVGAMVLALGLTRVTRGHDSDPAPRLERATLLKHGLIAVAAAVSVSALLFSSFFSNPSGIVDSYAAYAGYLGRATQHPWHTQPWYYYLQMLGYFKGPSGQVWSEAAILLLAGVGIFAAATKREVPGVDADLLRFIALYAVVILIVYSIIPYKTPWSMLSLLHGLILLAGVGVGVMLTVARNGLAFAALCGALLVAGIHLAGQSWLATHRYEADPDNPYVYSHPTEDVIYIAERVQAFADVHPDGNDLYIEVISPASDYWPLPWYLRAFPNTGWWEEVDMDVPAAPLIIAAPSVEGALLEKLYEKPPPGERYLYVPLFDAYTEIRPTVEIRGYVRKDLWDAYQMNR